MSSNPFVNKLITVGNVGSANISNVGNVENNDILSNIVAIIPIVPKDTVNSGILVLVKDIVDKEALGGLGIV